MDFGTQVTYYKKKHKNIHNNNTAINELAHKAQNGDNKALNDLCEFSTIMFWKFMTSKKYSKLTREEIKSICFDSFMKAVNLYDIKRGDFFLYLYMKCINYIHNNSMKNKNSREVCMTDLSKEINFAGYFDSYSDKYLAEYCNMTNKKYLSSEKSKDKQIIYERIIKKVAKDMKKNYGTITERLYLDRETMDTTGKELGMTRQAISAKNKNIKKRLDKEFRNSYVWNWIR